MERICVAMCTYQGERYLDEQLTSVATQTRLPDEMVIVDDASTDSTLAIAHRFAMSAPFPVRVVENPDNVGFVRNFERAIRLADGDVLVLSDQDDVWHASRIEVTARRLAERPDVAAVFSDALLVDERLRPSGISLSEAVGFSTEHQRLAQTGRLFEVLIRGNVVTGATLAFRSQYRELLLPLADGIEHDAWIALILAAVANVEFIARPLLLYRQHGGNQIGARRLGLADRVRRARDQRLQGLQRQCEANVQALDRLSNVGIAPAKEIMLRQAIDHLAVRSRLPERRAARVVPVLREVARGRYGRMSQGLTSACRDLLA